MKNIFFRSLRNSLITLVLLAVLPALTIILHSSLENRNKAIKDAQDEALRVVQFMGREQHLITMRAEQLLSLLAQMPQVQALDDRATSTILRRMHTRSSVFDNIVAADDKGRVFATALPLEPSPGLQGGRHFTRALEKNEFSVGEYELALGGGAQESFIHYAYPIPGPDGRNKGVLVTALRPDRYKKVFNVASLPEGSVLTLADKHGTRIYRYPAAQDTSPAGRKLVIELWDVISGKDALGITTVTQADGVRRIVAYTQLRLHPDEEPYLYLSVGIPEKQALAGAITSLYRELLLLAGAVALAILVAWVLGGKVISQPVERLARVARRLGGGDLDARSGPHEEFGEFALLASTMNNMADALSRDILARETVEAELRQSESLLLMILKALPVGVWMSDPEGRILYANQASRNLLGPETDALPDPAALRMWLHGTGEPLPPQDFVLARAIKGENPAQGQLLEVEPGAGSTRLVVQCDAIPIRDDEGLLRAVIVVMADITERTQREQARESIEHMMRHDLRSPLTGFTSLSRLLLRQNNMTEEQRDWAAKLGASANAMLCTIDAYLKLSCIERGSLPMEGVECDLMALARDALAGLALVPQLSGRHILLTSEGAPLLPGQGISVYCEPALVTTMLTNLVRNALEAAPEGTIAEIDFADRGDAVDIAVHNAGEVPPSIRQRFFEKYVTTGKRHGTGIGTYSARRIAEFHGGSISLDSSVPGHTTVLVRLPKNQQAEPAC